MVISLHCLTYVGILMEASILFLSGKYAQGNVRNVLTSV